MKQIDSDIKYLDFRKKFPNVDTLVITDEMLGRMLGYLQELKLFRMREIMNVKTELNSVESQMQLSKSELEAYNRLQTIRQLQFQSQIERQGDKW